MSISVCLTPVVVMPMAKHVAVKIVLAFLSTDQKDSTILGIPSHVNIQGIGA